MSKNDDEFLDTVRRQLDESCDNLDGETLSRLNQAKHAALTSRRKRTVWLLPASGLAVAASVALVAVNIWTTQPPMTPGVEFVEDIELLSSSEELEFYQNLDFYLWLEDEDPVT